MPDTLDIQKVINTSTSSVSLEDLSKKGFKQVKVLNQAHITKLIGEAVDQVLNERSKAISREERDKVIKEARTQFETLAKKRLEKERGRIDELEIANHSLTAEVDTLRKRLSASVELQASRDQAVARVQTLEGQLAAKNEELDRAKSGAASESSVEKLLAAVQSRMGKEGGQGDMSKLMLTLDSLSRKISNISGGGGGGGAADAELTGDFMLEALFDKEKEGTIESNVQNVKVKENKAAGVKGALAKLKKLQQGGADGE